MKVLLRAVHSYLCVSPGRKTMVEGSERLYEFLDDVGDCSVVRCNVYVVGVHWYDLYRCMKGKSW